MMAVGEGAPIEDQATGLFSEASLRAVLPTRIATARRSLKQLGLVLVQIDPVDGRYPREAGTMTLPCLVSTSRRTFTN